jgi:uncharacterized membrane protein YphA (DoxX/SURF4 family)
MQILVFITAFIIGVVLSRIIKPHAKFEYKLAIVYIIIALLLCINSCLVNFAEIQNKTVMNLLLFILNWGKSLSYLIIGYLTFGILYASRLNNISTAYQLNKTVIYTLLAISIINGLGFITETGYKIKNFDDLVSQFAHYGYAIWFLYFIIVAETLGGLGILLHFKLKTGFPAAIGLMLIMLGVVYTNWHTDAPFAYSYPAVDAFMSLALMLVIYKYVKKASHKPIIASIHVG